LKKRARLIDNDPLSPTDEVLLGFQQVSKSASQQVNDSPGVEPKRDPQEQSQLPEHQGMSTRQPVDTSAQQQVDLPTRQLAGLSNGQPVDLSVSQPDNVSDGQQANLSTQQPDNMSNGQQANLSTQQPDNVSDGQQVDYWIRPSMDLQDSLAANKPTNQLTNFPESQLPDKPSLKKSTFQLTETILQQLDVFHLHLQLELGKAKAPYKEVIVEEAICQLLATRDRQQLLVALQQRQDQRNH
jgi:hypothetical protein